MLPRPMSQRSIFHLGEEGEGVDDHRSGADEHVKSIDTARILGDHGRRRRKRDAAVDAVGVGLQILVPNHHHHHQHHHTRAPSHSHIVLKQVVVPPTVARHRRVRPCSSFLSACSRCRRELSSKDDVYMYRGDQGFCSEECRCQQILADEAAEREAMIKKERMLRRGLPRHLHHGPRSVMGAIGGASRRLVAIAY